MHKESAHKKEAFSVVILAAGMGTRMRSSLPKVLHKVGGLPLVAHVARSSASCNPSNAIVVIGEGMEAVHEAAMPHLDCAAVVQKERLGTAHAVLQALPELPKKGTVLVAYGDTPFISSKTMQAMHAAVLAGAGGVVLGFRPNDPAKYGRLVVENGALHRIVEFKDATEAERAIGLCNSGVMAFDAEALHALLPKVGNQNAAGEYYLTDMVQLLRESNHIVEVIEASDAEVLGINSQTERAEAEALFQADMRTKALEAGVQMIAPDTVHMQADTVIEPGAVIEPYVVFGAGAVVHAGAVVRAFSYIEGAEIAAGAVVGPYARLRPGANIGENAKVGNFVEIKQATLHEGAKVSHLSYVGDAVVGADANIGAGTITCNYDGVNKFTTEIGEGAFIGSNSSLVAPVKVGDGSLVAAGSTVRSDVPKKSLYYNDMKEKLKKKD